MSTHATCPYRVIPESQRWRNAFPKTGEHLLDPNEGKAPRFTFDKATPVATIGSCFAQNITARLVHHGYNFAAHRDDEVKYADLKDGETQSNFSAAYGNVYTARHLAQLMQRAYGAWQPEEDAWLVDGRYYDPIRPSVFAKGFPTDAALADARALHLANVRAVFENAKLLVVTLGLTEGWVNVTDGAAYPICPGCGFGTFDPAKYAFKNFTLDEVVADLSYFFTELRRRNPGINVILTVSPIPLIATYEQRHVVNSTVLSKSVLRVACDVICAKFDFIEYFSSYEIVNFGRDMSSYFTGDLRTVADSGIDHVMRVFFRRYCGDDIGAQANRVKYMEAWCDESYLSAPWYAGEKGGNAAPSPAEDARSGEGVQKSYVLNRVDLNQRFPHPQIGFRGRPFGVIERFKSAANPEGVKMDASGYWNHSDIRAFKGNAHKRIAIVGSSVIADFRNGFDQNVSSVVQRAFDDDGRTDVAVTNCGIVSSVSNQDLANLVYHALDLDPAVVVMLTGGSDTVCALVGDPRPGYTTNFHIWEQVLTSFRLWQDAANPDARGQIHAEFEDFSLSLEKRRQDAGFGSPEWLNAIFENYRRAVMKMRAVCLGAGVKLLLINAPTAAGYRLNHGKTFASPAQQDLYEIDVIERSRIFAEQVIPTTVPGSFVAVDWAAMFDDEPELPYVDRVHLTVPAYAKLGRRIYDEIRTRFGAGI